MSDIFYQYKILENPIELIVKPMNSEIEFLGNILNFYEDEKNEKLSIKVTAKVEILILFCQSISRYIRIFRSNIIS